jgi:hypothetical protein
MRTKAKKAVKKNKKVAKKTTNNKQPKVAKQVLPLTFHHVIILDKSGSMTTVRDSTINGFNENAVNIRNLASKDKSQTHTVTLVVFSDENKNVYWRQDINSLKDLTAEDYMPDGWTALCDAMGRTMYRLNEEILAEKNSGPVSVLVTIITDGAENYSKQYNAQSISKMIEGFKSNKDIIWTITYMGANQDVLEVASKYNIAVSNVAAYTSNDAGTTQAFRNLSAARGSYVKGFARAAKVGNDEDLQATSMNFFSATNEAADFTQPNPNANLQNPVNPPTDPDKKTT